MTGEPHFTKKMKNPGCLIKSIKFPNLPKDLILTVDEVGLVQIVFSDASHELLSYQLSCKTEAWSMDYVYRSPNQLDLYLGSAAGGIYCLSIEIGTDNRKDLDGLKADSSLKWQHKADNMVTKIRLCDVTGDGRKEIIASSVDHSLRVLDAETGNFMWGQLFQTAITLFSVFDCDNDGNLEIAASSSDGDVRVFSGQNGGLKYFSHFPKNVRTIELVSSHDSSISKNSLIVLGCDNQQIYLWDFINEEIIKSMKMPSYVWYSGKYETPNNQQMLFETSYTFDFMEGLVLEDMESKPVIRFFEIDDFTVAGELEGINIQCHSEILAIGPSLYMCCGTTDGSLHVIDLIAQDIVKSVKVSAIINCIDAYIHDNKLFVLFCDDASLMHEFEFSLK